MPKKFHGKMLNPCIWLGRWMMAYPTEIRTSRLVGLEGGRMVQGLKTSKAAWRLKLLRCVWKGLFAETAHLQIILPLRI